MRILYATRGYTPHDHRFLEVLGSTGHEIHFLGFERNHKLEGREFPSGIESIDWLEENVGVIYPINHAMRLRSKLARLKPDLVHAGPIQQVSAFFAFLGFHPLVSMSWGSDLLEQASGRISSIIARFALRKSDALLCDAHVVKGSAVKLGMSAERIIVFPWGVDLDHFHPGDGGRIRKELGWEGHPILLSTRNWEPIYGVDIVLQAFYHVVKVRPDVRLLLLGSGSMEPRIVNDIRQEGLEDRIAVIGRVSNQDLPDYYEASDLYLSASYTDGSSVSLLEAMACGLPVLVSDIPGNREWVSAGGEEHLFPPGDPLRMAEQILKLLKDRASLARMGFNNRTVVEERADWTKNSAGILRAYNIARGDT